MPLLWRPASCASLQDSSSHLVNTGNTKILNTSLLCLEDCHDNTQWISWRAGVFVRWIHTEMCPSSGLLLKAVQLWLMCSCLSLMHQEPLTAGMLDLLRQESILGSHTWIIQKECQDKYHNERKHLNLLYESFHCSFDTRPNAALETSEFLEKCSCWGLSVACWGSADSFRLEILTPETTVKDNLLWMYGSARHQINTQTQIKAELPLPVSTSSVFLLPFPLSLLWVFITLLTTEEGIRISTPIPLSTS